MSQNFFYMKQNKIFPKNLLKKKFLEKNYPNKIFQKINFPQTKLKKKLQKKFP